MATFKTLAILAGFVLIAALISFGADYADEYGYKTAMSVGIMASLIFCPWWFFGRGRSGEPARPQKPPPAEPIHAGMPRGPRRPPALSAHAKPTRSNDDVAE
jgi:hypothetical protein